MKAGCVDYIVAKQTVLIGRTAVELANGLISGMALEHILVEVPLVPVTIENLDSIDKATMQQPPGWKP